MRNLILILLLFKAVTVFSQEDINCSFDDISKYEDLINTESDVSYEILKDERAIEYFYEGEQLSRNITSGRIIKINDERAIDIFNKFSISLYNIIDILDIKVRTIQKDGNIIELDKSNIKEVENLDEEGSYKIFAIDGIEIGSIVEINYKTKNYPRLYGSYYFQGSGKTNNVLFKLVSPKHLKFDAKSYNSEFLKEDTIIGDKRYLTLKCNEIDPLDDTESYSFPDANKVRVEYSYRKNVEYHTTDYYSYNLAAQNIYSTLYQIDNKETKAIEKLISKINLNKLELEDKILSVEKYLKENFIIAPIDNIEDGINISNIIKNRYSSEIGIIKLFVNVLKYADIDHNVVGTCEKSYKIFDKDFMTWNYLNDYLIFFPETNKLLAPTLIEYRYPAVPTEFYYNDGLFLKLVRIGDMENAVHIIRTIPDHNYTDSYINHYITADFSPELDLINVNIRHSFGGNAAYTIKPYYAFFQEEQRQLMIKEYIKNINDDVEIVDFRVENGEINTNPFEYPFDIVTNLKIHSIIENAGNSYLLKVGELIGRQVELYQEHERHQKIDFNYPHILDREIVLNIPEGYEVKGLEKLNIDIQRDKDEINNDYSMGFLSNYELNGNTLKIKVYEYYKKPEYPIEQYEEFRDVVNAAADFTKIVLVLKPKS